MVVQKKWRSWRHMSACLLAAVFVLFAVDGAAMAAEARAVIPIGRAAGIKMSADGVMVVRISGVQTAVGEVFPAKQAGLREGDMIHEANGSAVSSNESLQKAVAAADGGAVRLKVVRSGAQSEIVVHPVKDSAGTSRIGVMVRDSIAGIGTITFVDPQTGAYGSLGHGICDADTGVLLPLGKGSVMEAAIADVKKGAAGDPGELQGEFNLQEDMGTVTQNTDTGIFGVLTDDSYYKALSAVPVAQQSEIQVGKAEILSNVDGEDCARYSVEITKVFDDDDDMGRGMMLHVTDPKLLEKTGGIVQGMSGSPVLQNGKLVGAVTHVLVNDPTRGYAVFIEKMLDQMSNP